MNGGEAREVVACMAEGPGDGTGAGVFVQTKCVVEISGVLKQTGGLTGGVDPWFVFTGCVRWCVGVVALRIECGSTASDTADTGARPSHPNTMGISKSCTLSIPRPVCTMCWIGKVGE
jgi:hypothetical protein